MKVGWNAYIYHIWKERNSRIFMQKEENAEQILEHIKTSIRFRLTGLRRVAADPAKFLCVALGVFLIQSLFSVFNAFIFVFMIV